MRKPIRAILGACSALIAVLSAEAQSSYSNAVLSLHPVAYWPLNETSAPGGAITTATNLGSLGASFNATLQGNLTFGITGSIKSETDTATGFDGKTTQAGTTYGAAIANGPSFTIEAWLLSHEPAAGTECALSDMDANSPRSGWLLYMDGDNAGQYDFRAYNKNGTTPSLDFPIGSAGSISADQWYHVVVVVSNAVTVTNVYGYVNGVLVSGPTVLPDFVPNDGGAGGFVIGARGDGGFRFNGGEDEVAYYTTALDPATIAAHYAAGNSASPVVPSYEQQVLTANPLLYYRLDASNTATVAVNYGSLGAVANGNYQPGTVPGSPGPSFFGLTTGFDGDNFSCQFSPSGTESTTTPGPGVACDTESLGILDDGSSITVSAWIKVPTGPVGWFTGVLGRGDSSYRFGLDQSGLPHFADGGNGNGDITGSAAVNDGLWHLWTGVYNSATSNAVLYIDTTVAGTIVWNPPGGTTTREFFIGGAPDYGNRNFVGDICQVAIFTNTITAGQVSQLYNSGAPSSFAQGVAQLKPVAYWPLNETAQPPVATSANMTNYGTLGSAVDATFSHVSSIVYGYPGALASDADTADGFRNVGGDDIQYAQATASANVSTSPSFTIEAWLLNHIPAGATQCALSDIDANNPRSGWLIYMDIDNTGQYAFRGYDQTGTAPSLDFQIGAANSIQADQWYHLVVVVSNAVTSTNVYGYVNGVLTAGPTPLPTYVPNDGTAGGLTIGARSDTGFGFNGAIDEVAYYTNALDPATILAHYQAGTNPAPATPYKTLVLQKNPTIYYRLDESQAAPYLVSLPVATNYGSFGAAANGYYQPGTQPGVPGPTNAGFGPSSLACAFSPAGSQFTDMSGVMCAPLHQTLFDFKNALTMTAWVQAPPVGSANLPTSYFESVMGCGDSSYRFDLDTTELPHFAAAPNGDVVAPATLTLDDNNWHFWAGVFDPVSAASYLYIDGLLVAQAPGSPLSEVTSYFLIGGVADYFDRNFVGNIAQVAVFTNALSAEQLTTLYNDAGTTPLINIATNAFTIDQGANGSFPASVSGSPPLTLQWYYIDSGSVTHLAAGETTATLSITNAQPAENGNQYYLVANNAYGSVTSSIATLSVVVGPPQIQVDVAPALEIVPVGIPVNYSVQVTGTTPFSYQWFFNGATKITGATNSGYTLNALLGSNTYNVVVSNSVGSVTSAVATLVGIITPPPVITFNSDGTGWSLNLGNNFTPTITTNALELTDGNGSEAGSAFWLTPQYVGGFVASFTYQEAAGGTPLADGITFCIQNATAGATAVGGGGGELGYTGIAPSAAFEINIYNGANGNIGIQYGTNGATADSPTPTGPYFPPTPVNVASGDPINVRLIYNQGTLSLLMTDATTSASYSTNFNVGDLTALLGADDAYIGFTGGTGGSDAIQTITNFRFSYSTPPELSVLISGANVTVSWPSSVTTFYVLQSSPNVQGPWANVGIAPTVANGENQVTTAAGAAQFYRLILQ